MIRIKRTVSIEWGAIYNLALALPQQQRRIYAYNYPPFTAGFGVLQATRHALVDDLAWKLPR